MIEEEKYMDQPRAAPAAGVILDAAGNLYGTTVGGRQHDVWSVFEDHALGVVLNKQDSS